MATRVPLTDEVIRQIANCVRLRMKQHQIAAIIGVHPTTLYRWVAKGHAAERKNKFRDLVVAIAEARAELARDLTDIVLDQALNPQVEETVKIRISPDGEETREITKKTVAPDATLAFKILERMHPDIWASVKRSEGHWQEAISQLGLDPKVVESSFLQYMETQSDRLGTIPIEQKKGA